MEEVKKLVDYKIGPGSTIIMVPSLRGGWFSVIFYFFILFERLMV
jgi:hypothetical protein